MTKVKEKIKKQGMGIVLPRQELPQSWRAVIGILKGHNINPMRYQREIRKGWGRRMKRQLQLAKKK